MPAPAARGINIIVVFGVLRGSRKSDVEVFAGFRGFGGCGGPILPNGKVKN